MTNYTRKNAWDDNNGGQFTNADGSYTNLYWYAKAVGVMKAKPISDPTSWWFYAAIHGEYLIDNFGEGTPPAEYPNWKMINSIPPVANLNSPPNTSLTNLFWDQCQHGTWFFAPWHRGYLVALENLLRNIIVNEFNGPADWALPYWNYLSQSAAYTECQIPPAFTTLTLPDGKTPNPLYVPERFGPNGNGNIFVVVGPGTTAPQANDACQYDTTYSKPGNPPAASSGDINGFYYGGQQTGFSHSNGGFGDLESNPHNLVHGMVGGNNASIWTDSGTPFTVDSRKPWQPTGITISPSSTVLVSYVTSKATAPSAWTADPSDNNGQLYDANGSPDIIVPASQPLYPIVNVPMGALVGKVGENGTPLLLGDGSVVPDSTSGILYLCINDDLTGAYGAGLTDNIGQIVVNLLATPSEEYEGLMADPGLAGLDPIFFLHHANIDRMWAAWNQTGNNLNPSDSNWLVGPQALGNSRFAMPMDANGTAWYYEPKDVNSTSQIPWPTAGSNYSYTYNDLSLASYSKPPAVALNKNLAQRLTNLGKSTEETSESMSTNQKTELLGASSGAISLNTIATAANVTLNTTVLKSVSESLLKASMTTPPNDVFLQLENVTGTNNSNFISVYVNGEFVNSVSLFGIRMASLKNSAHGGAGLTFKFNINAIVDKMQLNENLTMDSLNIEIKTKNPIAKANSIQIGRISIYRAGN
jgi:hypothetical protein